MCTDCKIPGKSAPAIIDPIIGRQRATSVDGKTGSVSNKFAVIGRKVPWLTCVRESTCSTCMRDMYVQGALCLRCRPTEPASARSSLFSRSCALVLAQPPLPAATAAAADASTSTVECACVRIFAEYVVCDGICLYCCDDLVRMWMLFAFAVCIGLPDGLDELCIPIQCRV